MKDVIAQFLYLGRIFGILQTQESIVVLKDHLAVISQSNRWNLPTKKFLNSGRSPKKHRDTINRLRLEVAYTNSFLHRTHRANSPEGCFGYELENVGHILLERTKYAIERTKLEKNSKFWHAPFYLTKITWIVACEASAANIFKDFRANSPVTSGVPQGTVFRRAAGFRPRAADISDPGVPTWTRHRWRRLWPSFKISFSFPLLNLRLNFEHGCYTAISRSYPDLRVTRRRAFKPVVKYY